MRLEEFYGDGLRFKVLCSYMLVLTLSQKNRYIFETPTLYEEKNTNFEVFSWNWGNFCHFEKPLKGKCFGQILISEIAGIFFGKLPLFRKAQSNITTDIWNSKEKWPSPSISYEKTVFFLHPRIFLSPNLTNLAITRNEGCNL